MNRADLMLSALLRGEPKSRRELFEHAGCFYLTNNAASELRARGYVIEQRRDGDLYMYQLHGLTEGEEDVSRPGAPALTGSEAMISGRDPDSPSVSPSLSQSAPLSPPRAHRDAGGGLATPPGGGADWLSDQLTLTEAAA